MSLGCCPVQALLGETPGRCCGRVLANLDVSEGVGVCVWVAGLSCTAVGGALISFCGAGPSATPALSVSCLPVLLSLCKMELIVGAPRGFGRRLHLQGAGDSWPCDWPLEPHHQDRPSRKAQRKAVTPLHLCVQARVKFLPREVFLGIWHLPREISF